MVNKRNGGTGEVVYYKAIKYPPNFNIEQIVDSIVPAGDGACGAGIYATTSLLDAVERWKKPDYTEGVRNGAVLILNPKGTWVRPEYSGKENIRDFKKADHYEKTIRVLELPRDNFYLPSENVEGLILYHIKGDCESEEFNLSSSFQSLCGRTVLIYEAKLDVESNVFSDIPGPILEHYLSQGLAEDKYFEKLCEGCHHKYRTPQEKKIDARSMFN